MQFNETMKTIFFSPPKSIQERIKLFVMLLLTFLLFFQPLQFSSIPPTEAFLMAMLPSVTISWGWIVLLRFKKEIK